MTPGSPNSLFSAFKALADESRLRLVFALASGEYNVQELTAYLAGRTQSTTSHHLKALQDAGLVTVRREGTWAYYSLARECPVLGDLLRIFEDDAHPWHPAWLAADRARLHEMLDRRRDRARQYFESAASTWDAIRTESTGGESFLDELAPLIPRGSDLLEIGCGTGALLKRVLPREGQTLGVDCSQAMLEQARANLRGSSPKVELRLGYLEHLPLPDESVDVVAAYMVMHHVAHPEDALRDAFRVMRPGGTFLLVDLRKHEDELMRERFGDQWLGFEEEDLRRWFAAAGYADVEIRPLGSGAQAFLLEARKHGGKQRRAA